MFDRRYHLGHLVIYSFVAMMLSDLVVKPLLGMVF